MAASEVKFKAGDRVRQVRRSDVGLAFNLDPDLVYTVDHVTTGGDLHLRDAPRAGYCPKRLELVEDTPVNHKAAVIAEAASIVDGARRAAYGPPENNFLRIVRFWNAWLENTGRKGELNVGDVAIMMDLMKTARLAETPGHKDSIVDKIGYTACYAELALDGKEKLA
jgi:hypothetical protein